MVRQEAPIGSFKNRGGDLRKAKREGYIKNADGTCYHHEESITLQDVPTIFHDRFPLLT